MKWYDPSAVPARENKKITEYLIVLIQNRNTISYLCLAFSFGNDRHATIYAKAELHSTKSQQTGAGSKGMNNQIKATIASELPLNLSTDTGSFYSNAYAEAQVLESNVHGKPRAILKSQKSDRYSSGDRATPQPVSAQLLRLSIDPIWTVPAQGTSIALLRWKSNTLYWSGMGCVNTRRVYDLLSQGIMPWEFKGTENQLLEKYTQQLYSSHMETLQEAKQYFHHMRTGRSSRMFKGME